MILKSIIDNPNTQIHDRSLSWLGKGISMKKSGGVKLVLWTQTYPFSEEFEDTKGVMREGQKNNDQKDKQQSTKHYK